MNNNNEIINKCFGKYISLLLSTNQKQIPLEIIQGEELSFIQQSFNESLQQVIENDQLEELQQKISLYSSIEMKQNQQNETNEIINSNEMNQKDKELLQNCYLHFIDICTFDEQFKQSFKRHLKHNNYSSPPSQHLMFSLFLKEYLLILDDKTLKQIFINKIRNYLSFSDISIIKNIPIVIPISFRQFFRNSNIFKIIKCIFTLSKEKHVKLEMSKLIIKNLYLKYNNLNGHLIKLETYLMEEKLLI